MKAPTMNLDDRREVECIEVTVLVEPDLPGAGVPRYLEHVLPEDGQDVEQVGEHLRLI